MSKKGEIVERQRDIRMVEPQQLALHRERVEIQGLGGVVLALRVKHECHVVEPDGDFRMDIAQQGPLHLEGFPVQLLGFPVLPRSRRASTLGC